MTQRRAGLTTVRLAGATTPGAPIDTSVTGAFVAVPSEMLDADDVVFRVVGDGLRTMEIESGDLLIVEPRPEGNAASGELVLVLLRDRAFVGRWWGKRGRRALLDDGLLPVIEEREIQVLGAITAIVREGRGSSRKD